MTTVTILLAGAATSLAIGIITLAVDRYLNHRYTANEKKHIDRLWN